MWTCLNLAHTTQYMIPGPTRAEATAKFAANLIAAREAADLTQEELADAAGLHRTAISFLERAVREPRLRTIVVLAKALDIKPAVLLDDID
jgi:transcriptional regulator with XRE-family HTH domain